MVQTVRCTTVLCFRSYSLLQRYRRRWEPCCDHSQFVARSVAPFSFTTFGASILRVPLPRRLFLLRVCFSASDGFVFSCQDALQLRVWGQGGAELPRGGGVPGRGHPAQRHRGLLARLPPGPQPPGNPEGGHPQPNQVGPPSSPDKSPWHGRAETDGVLLGLGMQTMKTKQLEEIQGQARRDTRQRCRLFVSLCRPCTIRFL